MTENVLKYFSKNCGTRNRVFRYVKLYYAYFIISFVLLIIIPSVYWLNNLFDYKVSLLLTGALLINFFISGYLFSEKAKGVLCEKYSLKKWKGMWNDSWDVKKILLMEDIEDVSGYLAGMKYDKCVPLIREELASKKQKHENRLPLIPTMIGALLVAEYNNYSSWDYAHYNDVISISAKHLVVIFLIFGLVLLAKQLWNAFYEVVKLKGISDVDDCLKAFEYIEMNMQDK